MNKPIHPTKRAAQVLQKRMALDLSLETISSLSLIPVERLKLIQAGSTTPHEHETALLDQLLVGDTTLTTDEAIGIAEPATAYLSRNTISKEIILSQLKAIFATAPKLRQVWVFGSFARTDSFLFNDIDLAITTDQGFSYFDVADLQFQLEEATGLKIDIGFADTLQLSFSADKELPRLIYAR